MIAGGVMVFVWKYGVRPMGGLLDIYELLPAFLIAIVVNVVVSLATAKAQTGETQKAMELEFENAMKD